MSAKKNKKQLLTGAGLIAGFALATTGYYWNKTKSNSKSNKPQKEIATKNTAYSSQLKSDYYGKEIELSEYYVNLLDQLKGPKLVFKHFMTCLSTPRQSEKLDEIRQALKKTAQILNVEYTQDNAGNVCLRKAASKGCENSAGVIIQCHMDMVCTKRDDCKHDFDNDPIKAYIDGEWLKAKGTTLGADDGIGVAAGLALLEHPNLKHGPLEILITSDEETTMNGAIELSEYPFLKNNFLINVDSEEDHRICIGCAGGFGKTFTVNMVRTTVKKDSMKAYKFSVKGLFGGHTGIEIHLGRANAIILMARIINYLMNEKKIQVFVHSLLGGNAENAIPCHAHCVLLIGSEQSELFEKSVNEYWLEYVLMEFKDIENTMQMSNEILSGFDFKNSVCNRETSEFVVSLMNTMPHGVIRWSPTVDGLVQTSVAFSLLKLDADSDKAELTLFARSSSMKEMIEFNRKLDCLSHLCGGNNNVNVQVSKAENMFPGWDPCVQSPLLSECKNAHLSLFNEKVDVYAVHAGLECGLIKDKYPKMDCVSIGPLIKHAHSCDEKLLISTVEPFYNWLVETVTRVAMIKQ